MLQAKEEFPRGPLENELQGELHDAWIMRVCGGEEIAGTKGPPHMVELSVVEGIVGLPAKFDGGRLFDGELLEQAHIEIGAIGSVQGVPADISERQSLRSSERARIEKQRTQPTRSCARRSMRVASEIGMGTRANTITDSRVVAEYGVDDVDGHSALRGGNAGQLPTA